jgi:antitoxin (DNA-binding transcriptional repressor) of toxin-antitoxin stability system
MRAGIRQVKNRLSYYLRRVKDGELVEVTDRGEVVAEIRSPGRRGRRRKTQEEVLAEMEREGLITRGSGRMPDFEPIKPLKPVNVGKMVLEDRR